MPITASDVLFTGHKWPHGPSFGDHCLILKYGDKGKKKLKTEFSYNGVYGEFRDFKN